MSAIGKKIEIKKPQKTKTNTISNTFNEIIDILKSKKVRDTTKLEWCGYLFNVLDKYFEEDKEESIKKCKNVAIPTLYKIIESCNVEYMSQYYDFYFQLYKFCARYDFECFVDYYEWNSAKKVYAKRREILNPYVDALNRIAHDDKLEYIVVSYAPSSGKSYLATLFSAWAYGLSINNSILRLSYSEELVLGFSRTVKGIISSPEFSEVFTNFKLYNGKPFEVEKESDWKIRNANVPKSNHIARTRGGATTGERASFAIILDDMTKGAEEANNDSVHKGIYDKWQTEWMNRRDGLHCKFIFIGTQWSPEDILNRIIKDREKVSPLRETNNKFVMETEDKSTIVIRVPLLDEEGKTTCSEVYPQVLAEQIRDNTDEFLFSCVYQQNPIPAVGRELSWESIRTYKEIPSEMPKNSLATLDTARKGKDYIAMPIFKSDENGSYYLTDAICIKKPMEDLYEEIINKIESNVITTLVVENNIDVSLKMVLSMKLQERNITYCNIIEKYNSANKQQRIKDYRGIVQKQIIFPDKTITKPNSDIGRLMENITKYSFELPNRNDDGIDAVCMFASEVIIGKSTFPKAKACRRPF